MTGNAIPSVQFADANGRLLPASGAGIQGTPYVFEKFGMGKVIFVNGMESVDSNLNYSYFDHKLYYTQKNGLYVVNQQAKSFELNSVDKENNKVSKKFMCLFPSIENNTPATFYEVLGNGDQFQLLKYTHKRIKETVVYGGAPVKEYVMDDLRDYRFYAEDLVHPNFAASGYVWDKLVETYMDPKTQAIMKQVAELQLAMNHKPFFLGSAEHQKFLESCILKTETLLATYPTLSLQDHLAFFKASLSK